MEKKKLLIVTLNDYIIYQPSILNLYDFLLPYFDITVISFKPEFATKKKDEERNIIYLETNFWLRQFYQKTDFFFSKVSPLIKKLRPSFRYSYSYYNQYLPSILKKSLKKLKLQPEVVIAVDLPTLHVAQKFFGSVHFLSLEIENRPNKFYQKFDITKIKSVFIQSKERYEYLFGSAQLRTFIVQNAPVFNETFIKQNTRKDFIYGGAMHRWLAVLDCIEFFNQYPEFRLVLKGGGDKKTIRLIHSTYRHLIQSNRIIIDQSYLPSGQFLDFLSTFRIGFCFYSWSLIESNFNFQSAPSGKLFMYLAAGTPVIACNIPGFQFVNEFRVGVLINDYKPETILGAVREIESNYEAYSKACYEAARHFSFDKHVALYVKFLIESSG